MTRNLPITLLICLIAGSPLASYAKKKQPEPPAAAPKPAAATIAEKVKKCKKIDGLFTLYRDTTTGSLMMLIKKYQLNSEFIYFSYVENGNTKEHLGTIKYLPFLNTTIKLSLSPKTPRFISTQATQFQKLPMQTLPMR